MSNPNESGWIKLHRKIIYNKGYRRQPFCDNMAWIDLLMITNYADRDFKVRGIKVEVKRGQCGYSELTLAERWQWSRNKVRRFLNQLESEDQISIQQIFKITTLITIVNYEDYQGEGTTEEQQTDIKETSKGTHKKKVKKEKNVKNEDISIPFEKFWDDYDKKVGDHKKMQAKWEKLNDEDRQAIIDYIPKYKLSQPDKQFRKNPSTFFNNRSWLDEITGVVIEMPRVQPKKLTANDAW